MKHALNLGKAEMGVLCYVAEHGPVTVRAVADHLAQTKGCVRTTVLNSMERLRRKGFLSRRKVEGVYQYLPVENKGDLFQRLLKGLVEYFAEHGKLTREEMRMLRNVAGRLDAPEE